MTGADETDRAAMRTATADSVAASADSRTATSDSRRERGYAKTSRRRNDRSTVTLIVASLALVVAGGFGVWSQHQQQDLTDCLRTFLANSVPLAQDRDAAMQEVIDDVKANQRLDPTDKAAVRAATKKFYADVATEQAASKALDNYRATHAPDKACPS